jgi:hypothetical protein
MKSTKNLWWISFLHVSIFTIISEHQLHLEQQTLTIDVSKYPSGEYSVRVTYKTGCIIHSDYVVVDKTVTNKRFQVQQSLSKDGVNEIYTNIYPNPGSQVSFLQINLPMDTKLKIDIYDKHIYGLTEMFMESGEHGIKIQVGDLPVGNYMVTIKGDTFRTVEKLGVIR